MKDKPEVLLGRGASRVEEVVFHSLWCGQGLSGSQNLLCMRITRRAVKLLSPSISDSVSLGWGLRICTSSNMMMVLLVWTLTCENYKDCKGTQTWLQIRITWGNFKNTDAQHPTNQWSLGWRQGWPGITKKGGLPRWLIALPLEFLNWPLKPKYPMYITNSLEQAGLVCHLPPLLSWAHGWCQSSYLTFPIKSSAASESTG